MTGKYVSAGLQVVPQLNVAAPPPGRQPAMPSLCLHTAGYTVGDVLPLARYLLHGGVIPFIRAYEIS